MVMLYPYNTVILNYNDKIVYQGDAKCIKSHQEIDKPGLYDLPGSGSLYVYYDGYKMYYGDDRPYRFEYISIEDRK
jgi:hypothetical protein